MNFHHIGIACKDINNVKQLLRVLFEISYESNLIFDPEQNAKLSMVELANGLKLELIQGKPVENIIKKGINYYHLCFCVPDIEDFVKYLISKDAILVKELKPALLFNGRRVAFLHTPIGLIELLEE